MTASTPTFDSESKITLGEAAKLAPGQPHASAVWRWCRKGIKAAGGRRIFLEHSRFGRRVFTSREAVARFGRALADADAEHFLRDDNRVPTPRTVISLVGFDGVSSIFCLSQLMWTSTVRVSPANS